LIGSSRNTLSNPTQDFYLLFLNLLHAVAQSNAALLMGSRFANAYRKYLEDVPKGLPGCIVPDAVTEAIASPDPKPRYLIGSGREKAGLRLRLYIPDQLFYSQVAKRLT
jgi:hypothetical protein